MKRQNIIAVVGYTTKLFWMLLIPLIRGLITIRPNIESVRRWAEGANWDLMIVVFMFVFAFGKWFFFKYEITDKEVCIQTGVFLKRHTDLPMRCICMASAEQDPIFRALKLVRLHIDTDAPSSMKGFDLTILAYHDECVRLMDRLSSILEKDDPSISSAYKVRVGVTAAFSFFFSSALSGTVLIITTISGVSKIIGARLENQLLDIVDGLSAELSKFISTLIYGISPVGIKISLIIAAGFLISFASNVIRLGNFQSVRHGRSIRITTGLIKKRLYVINAAKINMVDLRQNLMMKLIGVASVHISCTGYGKQKHELPVFIPICRSRLGAKKQKKSKRMIMTVNYVMKNILPEFTTGEDYVPTRFLYAGRFLWPPALWMISLPAAAFVLSLIFVNWHDLILFMLLIAEIPAVWMLLVKAVSYLTNGFEIKGSCVCAKYSSFYEFHTISVPFSRLAKLKIVQNQFQRLNRSCDVYIYTASERPKGQIVRSMPTSRIQHMIRTKIS